MMCHQRRRCTRCCSSSRDRVATCTSARSPPCFWLNRCRPVARLATGICPSFSRSGVDAMVLRRLFAYARPALGPMLLGVVLTGFASLATIGYASAVRLLINAVTQHSLRTLELALLAGLGLNILKNSAQYAGGYTMTAVGQRVVAKVRSDLFARIQFLPLQVFDRWRSGELISRFSNDVGLMVIGVTQFPLLTSAALTLIAALVYMFYLDWVLTLCTIEIGRAHV